MLRVGERSKRIVHVPKILYHWRSIPGSIAHDANAKGKIEPLQAAAVNAHFARIGFPGEALPHEHLPHRLTIRPKPRTGYPSIDVLVRGDRPAHATARCLALLDERRRTFTSVTLLTAKRQLSTTPDAALTAIVPAASPAVAELNRAIAASSGRYLVFIDPLVEVTSDTWLDHLLLYAELEDVGFVAPHLYRHDGRVVAAGLIIGNHGLMPAMPRFGLGEDGYAGSLACNREVSALPAGMIMMDRAVLEVLGGFDPDFSTPHYIFGDAAVRAATLGYRNIAVATPILRVDSSYDLVEPDSRLRRGSFSGHPRRYHSKGGSFSQHQLTSGPAG